MEGGGDGNCFRQRQWGAIRAIKLISRTNKKRERDEEGGKKDREVDLMRINDGRADTERNSKIIYSYFLSAVEKNAQYPLYDSAGRNHNSSSSLMEHIWPPYDGCCLL